MLGGLVLGMLAAACASAPTAGASRAGGLEIHVLSDRADLISGSDALVAVSLPRGVQPSQFRMTLNDSNVTDAGPPGLIPPVPPLQVGQAPYLPIAAEVIAASRGNSLRASR
jgi:hypothetical protein